MRDRPALSPEGRYGARPLPVLALALTLATGCAERDRTTRPELHLGSDECSFCRMILSEERHAAVAREAAGGELRFDDLGCLAAYHEAHAESEPWTVWVHTADRGWRPGEGAWIVRLPDRRTPMGSGLVAFAARDAAAAEGQDVIAFEDLLTRPHRGQIP